MNRNYIVKALRAGASETQIAQSMNVSPSAISQFIDTHNIKEEVSKNSQFAEIDAQLNAIEGTLASKLMKSLNSPLNRIQNDPMKIAQVLKIVNGAKRRSLAEGSSIFDNRQTLVQLNLPERALVDVRKNQLNEVIEVEGRALTTLPAGKLLQNLNDSKKEKLNDERTKKVADLL